MGAKGTGVTVPSDDSAWSTGQHEGASGTPRMNDIDFPASLAGWRLGVKFD